MQETNIMEESNGHERKPSVALHTMGLCSDFMARGY